MKHRFFLLPALLLAAPFFFVSCTNYFMKKILGDFPGSFVPVSGIEVITTVPRQQKDIPLYLIGSVIPQNASYKNIIWTVVSGGTIIGNTLTPDAAGSIMELRATITDGIARNRDFTEVYTIQTLNGGYDTPWLVYDETTLRKVGTGADGWGLDSGYLQIDSITLKAGNFNSIGSYASEFLGSYTVASCNNAYHTITGLTIEEQLSSNHGLFGCIGINMPHIPKPYIRGVTLIDCDISGQYFIGGIVGYNTGGTVEECSVRGLITGESTIGGIVGANDGGFVINCSAIGDIAGTNNEIGGVVGNNLSGGTVEKCLFSGTVKGEENTGGVVGYNSYSYVFNCYAAGDITGTGWNAGGIAGHNYFNGRIEKCYYSAGVINGYLNTGGIAGQNSSNSHILNCYATGDIGAANLNSGGVVGENSDSGSTVLYCYAAGEVNGYDNIAGIAGVNNGAVQFCVAMNKNIGGGHYAGSQIGRVMAVPVPLTDNDCNYARNDMNITWNDNNDGRQIPKNMITHDGIRSFWNDTNDLSVWDIDKTASSIWTWGEPDLPILRNMPAGTQNPVIRN